MRNKEQFSLLYEQEWFREFIEDLKNECPDGLMFNPESDNTDEWKYRSGMIEGFRLCLIQLGVNINE